MFHSRAGLEWNESPRSDWFNYNHWNSIGFLRRFQSCCWIIRVESDRAENCSRDLRLYLIYMKRQCEQRTDWANTQWEITLIFHISWVEGDAAWILNDIITASISNSPQMFSFYLAIKLSKRKKSPTQLQQTMYSDAIGCLLLGFFIWYICSFIETLTKLLCHPCAYLTAKRI